MRRKACSFIGVIEAKVTNERERRERRGREKGHQGRASERKGDERVIDWAEGRKAKREKLALPAEPGPPSERGESTLYSLLATMRE